MSKGLPPGWTIDDLMAAVEANMFGNGSIGICRECGEERSGCEPDAEGYECYSCGEPAVDGADNILIEVA